MEAEVAGVMGRHKRFIVGPGICYGRAVTEVSKGSATKHHLYVTGGNFASPRASQLHRPVLDHQPAVVGAGLLLQTTGRGRAAHRVRGPMGWAEGDRRFIARQCFFLLKSK